VGGIAVDEVATAEDAIHEEEGEIGGTVQYEFAKFKSVEIIDEVVGEFREFFVGIVIMFGWHYETSGNEFPSGFIMFEHNRKRDFGISNEEGLHFGNGVYQLSINPRIFKSSHLINFFIKLKKIKQKNKNRCSFFEFLLTRCYLRKRK